MKLESKTAVVLGVADQDSLGWAIARGFARQGARVTIGYQQKFHSRVRGLLAEEPSISGESAGDVLDPDEPRAVFRAAARARASMGTLVHSRTRSAPRPPLPAWLAQVKTGGFRRDWLEISAHSLSKVVHHARPHLRAQSM